MSRKRVSRRELKCPVCGSIREVLVTSNRKYCSKGCSNAVTLWKKDRLPWNKNLTKKIDSRLISKRKGIKTNKHPKSEFKKGHRPWSAGLTKETDIRIKKVAEDSERRRKISETEKMLYAAGLRESSFRNLSVDSRNRAKEGIRQYIRKYRKGKTWEEIYGEERAREMKFKLSNSHKGKVLSNITRNKMSQRKIGHSCYNFGRRSGFRIDLNCFFRSTWEANFARILNLLKIKWEYEKHRFYLEDCSYCPDFYLIDLGLYVEIKGFLKSKDREKLEKAILKYPNLDIKVLDLEGYQVLSSGYSKIISNWEFNKYDAKQLI